MKKRIYSFVAVLAVAVVVLTAAAADYRPAIVLDDVQGASFSYVKATAPKLKAKYFIARNCGDIKR